MKAKFLFYVCIALFINAIKSTNLIEVSPISNKILQLHFKDGQIDFHDLNQSRGDDRVVLFPGGRLSNSAAKILSNYLLISTTDSNYLSSKNPIDIGLNVRIEQNWDLDLFGRPTHIEETYVYLFLQNPLKENKAYTISVLGSAINSAANTLNFTFSSKLSRSESVHVNNLGYAPNAENKFGYVYAWLGDHEYLKHKNDSFIKQLPVGQNRKFYILNYATKAIVFQDTIAFRKPYNQNEFGQWGTDNNNFLGADVYECDFSNFNTPGEYVLSVEGIGTSFPFQIGKNVYHEPTFYTLKNIYENRSGIALNTPYAQYNRPICHKPGTNNFKLYYSKKSHYDLGPGSSDANSGDSTVINAMTTGTINVSGWYQDAGDWDAYWTHSKVPAYLMFLYETNKSMFDTVNLNLENESNNTLPDVLDEARWLLRFYKRCKDSIQTPLHGGTGGVPGGRVFGDIFPTSDGSSPEDGKGSWQDTKRKWVMLGEGPQLTFIYAGLAAHFAKLLQVNNHSDPENINWQLEAENAWDWAVANTKKLDLVPSSDYNLVTNRLYAAGALYRLTGNKNKYETQFIFDIDHLPNDSCNLNNIGQTYFLPWDTNAPSYQSISTDFLSNDDIQAMALGNYEHAALQHSNVNASMKTRVHAILKSSTNFLLGSNNFPGTMQMRACRWGGNYWLPMGIGQGTTPYVQLGAITIPLFMNSSDSSFAKDWLKNMYTTADYFLGTNPLNMTMISGLGEKNIHQVFHMDSWYCNNGNNTNIKKGFVSYGAMRDQGADLGGYGGFPAPYQYYYGVNKSYPSIQTRPGHERFMPSRTSPLANENTIHQTCISAAMTYGCLMANSKGGNAIVLEIDKAQSKNSLSNEMTLFPNPNKGNFTIQSKTKVQDYIVYDFQGKKVIEKKVNAEKEIQVSGLSEGIYFMKITDVFGKKHNKKFLVN